VNKHIPTNCHPGLRSGVQSETDWMSDQVRHDKYVTIAYSIVICENLYNLWTLKNAKQTHLQKAQNPITSFNLRTKDESPLPDAAKTNPFQTHLQQRGGASRPMRL